MFARSELSCNETHRRSLLVPNVSRSRAAPHCVVPAARVHRVDASSIPLAIGSSCAPSRPVSFVVIAFNEETAISSCLRSILGQRDCALSEIVVVDDASRDGTAAAVASVDDPRIRLVRHERNLGRGAARHNGFGHTSAELIAYVDGDILLGSDWFARCWAVMRDGSLDAVGGVAVPDGDVAWLFNRFSLTPRVVAATTTVTGNNGLYRRSLFTRATFDPSLREGEDVAFNHALAAAESRMATIPDLYVAHREDKSFVESIQWLFSSGRGATRMLARYRRVRVPDIVFAGWLGTLVISLGRRSPRTAAGLSTSVVAIGATGHVMRAFELDRRRPLACAGAIGADTVLLLAYLAGRVVGFRDLLKGRAAKR